MSLVNICNQALFVIVNSGDVLFVRLGDLDLDSEDDDAMPQDFKVIDRISHPEHKLSSKYNDIALLKLDRKAQFTKFVHPACLYTEHEIKADIVTAIGWGPSRFGEDQSNSLMKVDLELFDDHECKFTYGTLRTLRVGILSESQICAGGRDGVRDTCKVRTETFHLPIKQNLFRFPEEYITKHLCNFAFQYFVLNSNLS